MPITPTFPGIYIQEIQSNAHTVVAAPTNIAVFIGYSHPFKTPIFNTAIQLFSFSDYTRNFGGFFSNPLFSPDPPAGTTDNFFGDLAVAVNQFFLNGGTVCYVVGLQATENGQGLQSPVLDIGGIRFTALEPTDPTQVMSVAITRKGIAASSPPSSPPSPDVADIVITYGSGAGAVVETYRSVPLTKAAIEGTIGTTKNPVSQLVTVSPTPPGSTYPSSYTATPAGNPPSFPSVVPASPPAAPIAISKDFFNVFQDDQSLDKVPIFNLMVLPGVTSNIVLSEALAFCERKRAFLIIDPPQQSTIDPNASAPLSYVGNYMGDGAPLAPNAAVYFPYLTSNDPITGEAIEIPPAATVAGIFATTDLNRGVWKAPAGLETTIIGATGLVTRGQMSDNRQGILNQIAVNCLRTFPGTGTVVFRARTSVGADTNTAQQQWKYVPVRRMTLFLEQTLYRNLGWVVFEPNDTPLWTAIKTSIEAFMLGLFRQGAFQGDTPSQAFLVKCDNQTTTQADIDSGKVNIVVAFAPLKPAEFVIIQIAQLAGQTQTS